MLQKTAMALLCLELTVEQLPKPEVISEEEQLRWFDDWWRYADRDQEGVAEDENENENESEDSDGSDDEED